MALVAVTLGDRGETEIAVARYIVSSDNTSCEFAVVVADAWQRRGVGVLLMDALMDAARRRGLQIMFGKVLASNQRMLDMARRLAFTVSLDADDPRLMRVEARL
jgi:acetyltransferase